GGGVGGGGGGGCDARGAPPCPGKCLPQGRTPPRDRPRASAGPSRATGPGVVPKARSPITWLRGFDHTSRTGAKSTSMPTAASSRPIASPTDSTSRASPPAATVAAGRETGEGGGDWTGRAPPG